MSGGSFNYLCHCDTEDLPHRIADLRDMANALTGYGADTAAAETEDLIAYLRHSQRQIEARRRRLEAVWKAMEWKTSGDWGTEPLDNALKSYGAQ